MRPRPRKPQHPWRSRIAVATIVLVLVAVQLGLMAWLGEHGMLVLVDAAVVVFAMISILKIKTLFGFRLYQASFRELVIVASICLVFHVLVFPAASSFIPNRRPTAATGESQPQSPVNSSNVPRKDR